MIRNLLIIGALVLFGSGCENLEDNTPVCVPGSTEECSCHTGAAGEKTCDEDGLGHGGCFCLPDAGADEASDAGVDAGEESDAAVESDASSSAPGELPGQGDESRLSRPTRSRQGHQDGNRFRSGLEVSDLGVRARVG